MKCLEDEGWNVPVEQMTIVVGYKCTHVPQELQDNKNVIVHRAHDFDRPHKKIEPTKGNQAADDEMHTLIGNLRETATEPHNILILTGDGDFNEDIQNLEGDGHNVMVVHSRESISERFREDRQIRTFLGLEREADKTAKQRRREWLNEKKAARKYKSAREALSPLADLSYADQLEQKKASIMQKLEKLTGNERKACPNGKSLPELVLQSREIGGLSCKLEGIIESPLTNGYRNKCEFSTGYSGEWKLTVGVVLGTDSAGVTVVEEAVNCPSISKLACQYASIFRSFLEKSRLSVWNMSKSCGFWRQLTVREGSKPGVFSNDEDADSRIAEVMLMVQVCIPIH
ncbi:PREDICTED: zinc finger CCCH domain-containing protein 24-like [Brassica oleracea var. oleracea]|uniref:zinc finger CCCH domain-containing protein 24-like n=1 Tax=Brassica oleracea var. oleracea TaxID=109376 RepID=UPI0006A72EE3|nr:PREDICTED: zinc finger CCCH domain-containing protein 24-like [Brassica oleracea var. oleracea]